MILFRPKHFLHSVILDYNFALVASHAVLWNQDNQLNSEVILGDSILH